MHWPSRTIAMRSSSPTLTATQTYEVATMIITDKGIMIRQPVESIRTIGRNTQGVRLIRLDDGAIISSVTKVVKDDEEETQTHEENPTEE